MHKVCTYQVKVRGRLDEKAFNATSPLQMTVVGVDADKEHPCADDVRPYADEEQPYAATLSTVYTDQSGLIGLLRHLHGQGFVLLSVTRE